MVDHHPEPTQGLDMSHGLRRPLKVAAAPCTNPQNLPKTRQNVFSSFQNVWIKGQKNQSIDEKICWVSQQACRQRQTRDDVVLLGTQQGILPAGILAASWQLARFNPFQTLSVPHQPQTLGWKGGIVNKITAPWMAWLLNKYRVFKILKRRMPLEFFSLLLPHSELFPCFHPFSPTTKGSN